MNCSYFNKALYLKESFKRLFTSGRIKKYHSFAPRCVRISYLRSCTSVAPNEIIIIIRRRRKNVKKPTHPAGHRVFTWVVGTNIHTYLTYLPILFLPLPSFFLEEKLF
uniref:Uncharacterized protein n=1 Tax=Cacopsylla melanoneura TaxID=428564 RepID=A0A8D8PT80_9HEMI